MKKNTIIQIGHIGTYYYFLNIKKEDAIQMYKNITNDDHFHIDEIVLTDVNVWSEYDQDIDLLEEDEMLVCKEYLRNKTIEKLGI